MSLYVVQRRIAPALLPAYSLLPSMRCQPVADAVPSTLKTRCVSCREYSLFRSEFFELLVRMAKTKYMYGKRPITKSWTDAIRMLLEEHLLSPEMQSVEFTFDKNVFRKDRLYRLVS